jgi:hypothetical protein
MTPWLLQVLQKGEEVQFKELGQLYSGRRKKKPSNQKLAIVPSLTNCVKSTIIIEIVEK